MNYLITRDQLGSVNPPPVVMLTDIVLKISVMYRFPSELPKAMSLPSGENVGDSSPAPVPFRTLIPEPSGLIIAI